MRSTVLAAAVTAAAITSTIASPTTGQVVADGPALQANLQTTVTSRYLRRGRDLSAGALSMHVDAQVAWRDGIAFKAFAREGISSDTRTLDELHLGVWYNHGIVPGWQLNAGHIAFLTFMPFAPLTNNAAHVKVSGALYFGIVRSLQPLSLSASYMRKYGPGAADVVSLRVKSSVGFLAGVVASPFIQADYEAPSGVTGTFEDRMASVEAAIPLRRAVGPFAVTASCHLTWIPSAFVQSLNEAAGLGTDGVLPWVSLSIGVR
jgi:hypothetical protein